MRHGLLGLVCCALLGCTGEVVSSDPLFSDSQATTPECVGVRPDVPVTPLRRLQPEQYLSSLRDVLGTPELQLALGPPSASVITLLEVDKLNAGVDEALASGAHLSLAPCSSTGAHDTPCAEAFIDALGTRAFRRPLTAAERTWLRGVYTSTRDAPGVTPRVTFRETLDVVAQVILQSPQMVYRVEQGTADPKLAAGLHRTTGYERAARLSYLFWNTTPDQALLEAAAAGRLDTEAGLRAEATRLLDSPRARAHLRTFAGAWLDLDAGPRRASLEGLTKTASRFPFDSPALRTAMRRESEALFEAAFFDAPDSLDALFNSTRAYVNKSLASLYGVAGPASDDTFAWVELDGAERAGALTRLAFLTVEANQDYASPIHRGVHLYRNILCQVLGPPPPDADNTPAKPGAGATPRSLREMVDLKTAASGCQGCHRIVNPLGHTLGNYDAMGRWQTHDVGTGTDGEGFTAAIDAAATMSPGVLEAATVAGPVALSRQLSEDPVAQNCLAQKFFARAMERAVSKADQCGIAPTQLRFRESGNLRALLVDLAASPAMQLVRPAL